jgi:L,D-transpeptidase ErfK/SrfK
MKITVKSLSLIFLALCSISNAYANRYVLSSTKDTVIGETKIILADERDTLLDIARRHGFGYQDMKMINPDVDTWLPGEGQEVILPGQFILPVAPQEGIVLNIPEMRLYYYLPKEKGKPQEVLTYPLGVGREGWNTPYIKTYIAEKKENPNWYPPASIRKEHEEKGDPLPKVVMSGPDNPLGSFAMRLGRPDYLIHGTNKPYGLGMRISHGCIRLYPEDIEALFAEVAIKTPVNIINQPYKIGVKNSVIYIEAHPFMVEDSEQYENNLTSVISLITDLSKGQDYELDWSAAYGAINSPSGLPVAIGMYIPEVIQAKLDDVFIDNAQVKTVKKETQKSPLKVAKKSSHKSQVKVLGKLTESLQVKVDGELSDALHSKATKKLNDDLQAKVAEKLNKELTQAEKVNLQLRMDSDLKN